MSSNISYSNMNFYSKTYTENKVFTVIKVRNKKKWTKEEDLKLIKFTEINKEKHWKEISKNFQNKNPLQCFSRYKRIKPGIKKGTWTKEEDDRILTLVGIYGKSWSKLAKDMKSRNGKQIRDRFINVLDPDVKKGKFTYKEDRKIKELYLKYGPRWALIVRGLRNRTPDMIKNRFHSSIKKFLLQKNFISKIDNNSKTTNRVSASNLKLRKASLKNSNSGSYFNISISKSLEEKSFLNTLSNISSPILEANSGQILFQNKLDQIFYNENKINFNLYPAKLKSEPNNYVNDNTYNSFDKNFSFENFSYKVKTELKNLGVINTNTIKIKEENIFTDSERTVSNSDYSFRENERNNQSSRFKSNNKTNEANKNDFEFPDETIQNESLFTHNSNSNSQTNLFNMENKIYFNNNYQINCQIEKNILNNFEINPNYLNCSTLTSCNLDYNLKKENKVNEENKNNKYDLKSISKKNSNGTSLEKNSDENYYKNKQINNENIKNNQGFEKIKSNQVSDIKITSIEKIIPNNEFFIESLFSINSQKNNEFESNANNNYFLNYNENSRSTNLVTYQNISSYSSNSFNLDENENTFSENLKNTNGKSDLISRIYDNNQTNFLNFLDSPFRINSKKYYDFEDFFNSN